MNYNIDSIIHSKDDKSLLNLWQSNVDSNFKNRLHWVYNESPCEGVITIIARNAEDAVIGCASCFSNKIKLKQQEYKYGVAFDFIVHENFRLFGPAIKLQKNLVEKIECENYEFILAFPNKASYKIFERVGYQKLGEARVYVKLIDCSRKINIKNRILKYILAKTINVSLNIIDYLHGLTLNKNYTLEYIDNFELCDLSMVPDNSGLFLLNKDKSYLNWRYVYYKGYDYKIVCLKDGSTGVSKGYCVYFIKDGIVNIVDIFVANNMSYIKEIIIRLANNLRSSNVFTISVMYLGRKEVINTLNQCQFVERADVRNCYIYFNKNDMDYSVFMDVSKWTLFDADMDL